MKILHTADLHIGKRLNEVSLIEDQRYILNEIIKVIKDQEIDVLIVAGDIYDQVNPSLEAVQLLDDFLIKLSEFDILILIISGNHDSKERLTFGSSLFKKHNIFIVGDYDHEIFKVTYLNVNFYLLPFIRPIEIKRMFNVDIKTHQGALKEIFKREVIDTSKTNILIAHEFVSSNRSLPELSESERIIIPSNVNDEMIIVGTLDNVDASLFKDFDYVALGHIHKPQKILKNTIRYSGSPLAYSASEANSKKSVTLINVEDKEISIELIDLKPKRNLLHFKGYFDEIMQDKNNIIKDYVYITLLDQDDIYDVANKLREKYPNLMNVAFNKNLIENTNSKVLSYQSLKELSPYELFEQFYYLQNDTDLSENQKTIVENLLKEENDEN